MAEFSDGVGCYALSETGEISLKASFSEQSFNTSSVYIVDINANNLHSDKILYALDGTAGVYKINMTESAEKPSI